MFDNLAVTFYNNVVAAYDEYVSHRDSAEAGRDKHLRTAVAAASALYHFREHLPASLNAAMKNLEQTWPDYALMQGVTNASKHRQVTRGKPLVASAEDIREVTVIVHYSDDKGEYSHAQTKIDVTCTDGTTRWLDAAITRVLNHWGTVLNEAGVCGYTVRPEPEPAGSRYLARSEASAKLTLEAMRGLDFRQSMQLLRFDHTLGRAIPVDLTGADVRFRVYQPPQHIIDVTMLHPKIGEVTASIPLTDDENIEFHNIDSQADHSAFMESLFEAHRSEIEEKLQEQLSRR